MVRRTLEELREDQKTTENNLNERLQSLSGKIAIATRLVEGLDDLRLLGNDAAHVELKDFDAVGEEELVWPLRSSRACTSTTSSPASSPRANNRSPEICQIAHPDHGSPGYFRLLTRMRDTLINSQLRAIYDDGWGTGGTGTTDNQASDRAAPGGTPIR
jgi:hypothetical protein